MELKKFQKLVEVINTYYAFAVLVYLAALYVARYSHLFFWVIIAATPLLAGWTGYLLKSFLEQRNQRHGFKILSNSITYEIGDNRSYILRYATKLKACANHLVVYPMGHQWSGNNQAEMPQVPAPGQQLLGVIERRGNKNEIKISPYKFNSSAAGDWHYWFVAFNPPVHQGDVVEIKYSQEFKDTKNVSKPSLYYIVSVPMEKLELNVKFPPNALPQTVTSSYIKPSDPRRPYPTIGVKYDSDKQWATWIIERPKKGYCYRIQWQ